MPRISKTVKEIEPIAGRNPNCTKCSLHKTSAVGDKSVVCLWGVGNIQSPIMFVGEALGKDEVLKETPFIGEAGQLFNRYLLRAGINRNEVYISNVCKCRPPSNRVPKPMEIRACSGYLDYEINTVKPKVITTLGNVALKRILNVEGVTKLRGKPAWSSKYNCWVIPTFHPSYILRNGESLEESEQFVSDLKYIKKVAETGRTGQLESTYKICDTMDSVIELIKELKVQKVISVDTETYGNYLSGKILTIQFSWKAGSAYAIPFYKPELQALWTTDEERFIWTQLQFILESTDIKKVGQNIKYDYQFFKLYGVTLNSVIFDTMLAHYLLDENDKGGHGLGDLALKFTDMGDYSNELYQALDILGKDVDPFVFAKAPLELLCKYGAKDADCTFRVFCVLYPKIKEQGLMVLLTKLMIPLSFVLAEMEMVGILPDLKYVEELTIKYKAKIQELETKLFSFSEVKRLGERQGKPVNFRSSDQLRVLFYDILQLPVLKFVSNKKKKNKQEKKTSTDQEVLEKLAEKHEIPKLLLEYRKLTKFLSTYIEPIPQNVKSDGRIHTSYKQDRTVTGRLASSDPNLQNIPKRDKEKAKEVRNCFIATEGYTFIEADFKQIEFRLLLDSAKEERGIEDLKKGLDIHKVVASQAYQIPLEKVSDELRYDTKTVNYSVIYGKGKENLAKENNFTVEQVERVLTALFSRYPKIQDWIYRIKTNAQSTGMVTNWIGRRRRLEGFKTGVEPLIEEAKRQAVNAPLQGGAHDILTVATLRVYREFKNRVRKELENKGLKSRLVMNIHDSLVVEAKDEEIETVASILKEKMEMPIPNINVPLEVELSIGKRLGDMVAYVKPMVS